MASQLPPTQRTQGDGMERVENNTSVEYTAVLRPRDCDETVIPNNDIDITSCKRGLLKNLGAVIKLTPQAVDVKKKDVLSGLRNKEPKFVPYEPYKAAVRPIIPFKKVTFRQGAKKKSRTVAALCGTHRNLNVKEKVVEKEEIKKSESKEEKIDWEAKSKMLESEIQTLRDENQQVESQLKFQVQVNGELKNLLVAAVGEDMETKVHVLTEDKLHLAQALLHSAESLTTHQEQIEWLAGQCEVWRSKFLASSVMVEELARWKASLCQKVNEAHEALRKLLEEGKQVQDHVVKTHINLCRLRDNFDLHNKKRKMTSSSVIDISAENLQLSEILLLELLGLKKSASTRGLYVENVKKTSAEKYAEHILSNPRLLQLIGEKDDACNAVVGAAVNLSGQLYLQSHPPEIGCCRQCTGEIKLI